MISSHSDVGAAKGSLRAFSHTGFEGVKPKSRDSKARSRVMAFVLDVALIICLSLSVCLFCPVGWWVGWTTRRFAKEHVRLKRGVDRMSKSAELRC